MGFELEICEFTCGDFFDCAVSAQHCGGYFEGFKRNIKHGFVLKELILHLERQIFLMKKKENFKLLIVMCRAIKHWGGGFHSV